jgi:hypothetical protein
VSGEVIEKILAESKETKIPIRKTFEKYYPEAKIITEIRAGKGIPKIREKNRA